MSKKIILLLTLVLISVIGPAQPLSPSAKISVVICAPGDEIYSYFGHAAIRVCDPVAEKDIVFNYGVFSFDAPHFIWRFAKGETDYQLAVFRMSSFMGEYREEGRKVVEYELLLNPGERDSLYNALVENYKPENRVYRYSHFEDNCATRIRDQIEKALGGRIRYNSSGDETVTFRNLIDRYIQENSWSGLGIKLALGMPTDQQATFPQKMFLPDFLGNDMVHAVVLRDGIPVPLTGPAEVVFDAPAFQHGFSWTSPAVFILLLFLAILVVTFREEKIKKRLIWLDVLVFVAFGIASLVLYFTTFISVMPSTKWNLNLLWAWPTHLVVAVLWMIPSMRPRLGEYFRVTKIALILFLAGMLVMPQSFHWLVVPLCLILLMRSSSCRNFIWSEYYDKEEE